MPPISIAAAAAAAESEVDRSSRHSDSAEIGSRSGSNDGNLESRVPIPCAAITVALVTTACASPISNRGAVSPQAGGEDGIAIGYNVGAGRDANRGPLGHPAEYETGVHGAGTP